ncbi:MAG TPA: ATP-binding protein [Kouleothrix sp.]|uniref:sensor histidine kinase n=1 Tax=Kouleothrix sp. TaxID=2779161 RepID=UPI002C5BE976|nr:ATP-binding protein [Kouleothrix sp.]HRC76918.1 ATP-binding protein [Kouleothrix sp.]
MGWLRHLRWKLFVSHLSILVIGVLVLLATAHFLASTQMVPDPQLSLGQSASETGQVTDDTQPAGAISQQVHFQAVVDQSMLISAFAALAAAVVVSLFVSRRIVEPLQELTFTSQRLARGHYHERTTTRSDDELADLSQSINQLAEALEQTEQRRLALLADVAHELRTPLTTIEGYMEGLIDGVIAPEEHIFAMIQHEAARLKWLIEELALLSRAEAGQLRVAPRPLALRVSLRHVIAQFQPQFNAKGVYLASNLPPDLPEIMADPDRLEQILINLLSNALRYTAADGQVTIAAEAHDYFVQISVRDTGIGISAEHLPHIFERFYRVDKSRARHSGGTGIGLTITRHLVYAQGGEIWADSDGPGRGTTFYLTLPVHDAVAAAA